MADGRKTLVPDDEDPDLRAEINDGHCFERMDRAAVALDYMRSLELGARRNAAAGGAVQRSPPALGLRHRKPELTTVNPFMPTEAGVKGGSNQLRRRPATRRRSALSRMKPVASP
jgi:hypothetical protein